MATLHWTVDRKPKRKLRGRVLWVGENRILAIRGRRIWSSVDQGQDWVYVGCLRIGWRDWLASLHPWMRRLLRRDIHHAVDLEKDRFLLCGYRGFHILDARAKTTEHLPCRWHGTRPLALCRREDKIYYGEYRNNLKRLPVSIWRSDDEGRSWTRAWKFDGVRHVHGVYWDPHEDALWATTGDLDTESGLWRTRDGFRSLERVVSGSQSVRVVQLLFTPTAILFGSDAPTQINYLYSMDRRSGAIRAIQQVEGSVFYGAKVGHICVFATVVEPSRVNRSAEAVVWLSSNGGHSWSRLMGFRKDWLPMRLFQYGQVLFPSGPGDRKHLWLTPFATRGDQISLCFEIAA